MTARANSSPSLADTLRQIQTPVQEGLREVIDEMWRIVANDNPLVSDVNAHLLLAKGKMVRPTLLLLSSNVDGSPEPRGTTLAAVAEFQKALRGHSNRVRAYEALGQCFVEKDQYQVAASVLSRAIAIGEGDDHHLVGVLYLLGRATEELNRNRDALDYYQRVFAVDIGFRDVADRLRAIEGKAT